jgi:hypothetical protein
MNPQFYFPSNGLLFLEIVQWALFGFAIVWVIAQVMGVLHRRAYNLTYAESGSSKKVQPDFLKVDTHKRQDAVARGERFDDALDRGDGRSSPIGVVRRWSGVGATLAALVSVFFSAVMTLNAVTTTDGVIRDLGNWEKLKMLLSQHQLGAIVCAAVIVSNAYAVLIKLQKNGQ